MLLLLMLLPMLLAFVRTLIELSDPAAAALLEPVPVWPSMAAVSALCSQPPSKKACPISSLRAPYTAKSYLNHSGGVAPHQAGCMHAPVSIIGGGSESVLVRRLPMTGRGGLTHNRLFCHVPLQHITDQAAKCCYELRGLALCSPGAVLRVRYNVDGSPRVSDAVFLLRC